MYNNTRRREIDEHSNENNILDQENMEQIVPEGDSTKDAGIVSQSSPLSSLVKEDCSNPMESSKEKSAPCITSDNYSKFGDKKFLSDHDYSKPEFDDDNILKDFQFKNSPHLWNPNLKQPVDFSPKPFASVMDVDKSAEQSFNQSFLSEDSKFSKINYASQTSSFEKEKRLNLPNTHLHTKRLSEDREVDSPKMNLLCTEEIATDNHIITTLSDSSEIPSISFTETGFSRNPDTEMEDTSEDSDYIDVYDPSLPSGSKLFKCDQCRLRFNNEVDLRKHFLLDQCLSNVKLFKCYHINCNTSFASKSELADHLSLHQMKIILENRIKRKLIKLKLYDVMEDSLPKKQCKIHQNNFGLNSVNENPLSESSEEDNLS